VVLLVAFVASLVLGSVMRRSADVPSGRRSFPRFAINIPAGEFSSNAGVLPNLAIAPDGSIVAFGSRWSDSSSHLYLKTGSSIEPALLRGTEGGSAPFFSPDARWVAFFSGNKLKRVATEGGYVETIADVVNPRGGTWSSQGQIVFTPDAGGGLWIIRTLGAKPERLTTPAPSERHWWPHFLPGGDALLFSKGSSMYRPDVAAIVLRTGEVKTVVSDGTMPTYVDRYLVFARSGTLMAVPFDPVALTIAGAPVPMLDGVMQTGESAAQFAAAADGTLVYAPGPVQSVDPAIVSLDLDGVERPIRTASPLAGRGYRISPDGQRLVYTSVIGGAGSVFVFDLQQQVARRLTFTNPGGYPIWSSDGARVTYGSTSIAPGLLSIAADGTGREERLTSSENRQVPESWSPDGRTLLLTELAPETGWDIWRLAIDGEAAPKLTPFLNTRSAETSPMFSPDGRWVAYTSDESGRAEVYVQSFAPGGGKWQVSSDGGLQPVWASDGRALFFGRTVSGTQLLMSANVDVGGSLTFHMPKQLVDSTAYNFTGPMRSWDVFPDGKHFLVNKASVPRATQLYVLTDWLDELRSRVK
jgi:Tol biopolymer transport system component